MEILKMEVDWMEGWANEPNLKVLINNPPKLEDLIYTVKDGMYWAEKDGYVSFFYYRGPGDGFGGRKFTLKVDVGDHVEEMILKGPWSSRSSCANAEFPHSIEVVFTSDVETWLRGYTFYAGHMLVSFIEDGLKKFLPDIKLIKIDGTTHDGTLVEGASGDQMGIISQSDVWPGEIRYLITKNGKTKRQLAKDGEISAKGMGKL